MHSEDANNRPELDEEEAWVANQMLQQAAEQIFPKLNGEPVLECATPTSGEFQSGNIEADPATPAHVVDDHWEYNYQLGVLVRFHYQGRNHLYVPEDDFVQVCLVEIYELQDTRMTVWHYTDPQHDGGVQRVHLNDWRSTGPAGTGDELWQGMTVFRLEGFPGLDQGVLQHLQDGNEPEFPDNLGEDLPDSDGPWEATNSAILSSETAYHTVTDSEAQQEILDGIEQSQIQEGPFSVIIPRRTVMASGTSPSTTRTSSATSTAM